LQAKRKISEKLEQLNKAKEQIEAIQREIDEMKEQENSSLWQESPQQNAGPAREPPKENFFAGNGVSHFVDSESPLSIGLQTTPWPPKFKPVSLPKYNGQTQVATSAICVCIKFSSKCGASARKRGRRKAQTNSRILRDEDITTNDTSTPAQDHVIAGPITRARARQLNNQGEGLAQAGFGLQKSTML
jgi:hypothetical protein